MATRPWNNFLHYLRSAVRPVRDETTDGALLESFLLRGDRESLGKLIHRHGPLVWGVCRRVLRHAQDAEDAFQATFLVLVRKASTIRHKECCAHWLYGVAYQTALKARAVAARRKNREQQVMDMPEPAVPPPDPGDELQPLLDRELIRLPEKYRMVLILCDLEGRNRSEAARHLGWPEGTVAGRLFRARNMLAKRLSRYGLAVSGTTLTTLLAQAHTTASVPPTMISAVIQGATLLAAGKAGAGATSASVAALIEGVLRTMYLTKLKIAASALLLVSLLGGGIAIITQAMRSEKTAVAGEASLAKPPEGPENKGSEIKIAEGQSNGLPPVDRSMNDLAFRLPDGDWLVYRHNPRADTGVFLYRMDSTMTRRRWQAHCTGIGVSEPGSPQQAEVFTAENIVVVKCVSNCGGFVEHFDLATGKQIERQKIPGLGT